MSVSATADVSNSPFGYLKNSFSKVGGIFANLSTLEDFEKITNFVQPLIALVSLQLNQSIPKNKLLKDLEALRSFKESITWIKTTYSILKKPIVTSFLAMIQQVLKIGISILNFSTLFLDKLGVKTLIWISDPFKGISLAIGNISKEIPDSEKILPVKLVLEIASTFVEFIANVYKLYQCSCKKRKIQAKILLTTRIDLDLSYCKYQERFEQLNLSLISYCENFKFQSKVKTEGVDNSMKGTQLDNLNKIRRDSLRKKIYLTIELFAELKVRNNWIGVRNEIISKFLEKSIRLINASEIDEKKMQEIDQNLQDVLALTEMDDEKLMTYKSKRFAVSLSNENLKFSKLIKTTIVSVFEIISLAFNVGLTVCKIKKIAEITNLSESFYMKVFEAVNLLIGTASLLQHISKQNVKKEIKPRPSHPAFSKG